MTCVGYIQATACFNGYLNLTHYYVMRAVCEHDNDKIKNDEKEILLDTFDDDFLIFTRGNITNFTVTWQANHINILTNALLNADGLLIINHFPFSSDNM